MLSIVIGWATLACLAATEAVVIAVAEDYVESRVATLRKAMRASGATKDAVLPVAFIENSSHCAVNSAGEKVIGPNKDRRWLPELMAQVRQPPLCSYLLVLPYCNFSTAD